MASFGLVVRDSQKMSAVDAGQVDVKPMPPAEVAPAAENSTEIVVSGVDLSDSYKGYEDGFRTRLKMDEDNRPKVGLWVSPLFQVNIS